MATRHLHLKGLRTDNILQRLVNDGIQTGCRPNSLAFLPEDIEAPYLSTIDRALIPVFRRLDCAPLNRHRKYDVTRSITTNHDDSVPSRSAKRIRRHYDDQPADGLMLLLDLLPLSGPSGNSSSIVDRRGNGTTSSNSGMIRQRREAHRSSSGYSESSRNSSRIREIGEVEGTESGSTHTDDDCATQAAKRFISLGGLPLVISILLLATKPKPKFTEGKVNIPPEFIVKDSRTKRLCLDVLSRLCCLEPETAELLNEHQELSAFCFHCLACNKLRESACKLIELLLMARSEMLNLCSIPMLKEVLSVLDGKKLDSLCRILSITVSDLDSLENKQSLLAQNKQKRSNTDFVPIRELNQELIMCVPGLLKKILQIAVNEKYLPRYANSPTEIDHWMRFIDDNISNEIANDLGGVGHNFSFTSMLDYESSEPEDNAILFTTGEQDFRSPVEASFELPRLDNDYNAALNIGEHLLARVEALYVISLLLVGKHRKQMQKELAELELLPKLSNLMDSFVWRNRSQPSRFIPGHFTGCECSPEVAVKIQFLRLLHSFCDQNEYKHLLLTPCELQELRRIQVPDIPQNTFYNNLENTSQPLNDDNMDTSSSQSAPSMARRSRQINTFGQSMPVINAKLMCRGTQGLLTKIVEVLKKELTQSTFRFWLCRAIESFLRGRISYADQIFLLRRGLLQHVTSSIVNTEHRTIQHEIIQSSFDLLGEMIKFNIDACKQLDAILNTEAKLKKTMILINDNLIDSNMFIRYVSLY